MTQPLNEPMNYEARRYCHGDDAWTNWQPCTEAQATVYRRDGTFEVRVIKGQLGKGKD